MSQHDYAIADADGATFLADLNAMAQAVASNNSGATAPSPTYAHMWWPDTANDLLKQRNAANSAWIDVCKLSTWALPSVQKLTATLATVGGTGTAITATQAPATSGAKWVVLDIVTGNGGAATTLAVNGDAAKNVKAYDSAGAKVNTTTVAGQKCLFMDDGTDWVLVNPLPAGSSAAVQGSFKNLAASANGISANVTITADEIALEDTSNAYVTARSVNVTINTAVSGANGLDTGTIAASTWYYTWVIRKPDGTTAGLASLSSTAPTMPSGYTYKARVGAFRTDGTGNKYPLAFRQRGCTVQYVVAAATNVTNLPTMITGASGSPSTPTWTAVGVSNFVPTTAAKIRALLYGNINAAGTQSAMAAPNNQYGAFNSTTNSPPMVIGTVPGQNLYAAVVAEMILESTNVYYASTTTTTLFCLGWEDNL